MSVLMALRLVFSCRSCCRLAFSFAKSVMSVCWCIVCLAALISLLYLVASALSLDALVVCAVLLASLTRAGSIWSMFWALAVIKSACF